MHTSTQSNKKSVLIADGHTLVAEALGHLLENTGRYSVTTVKSLLEARAEIITNGTYDVTLLDLDTLCGTDLRSVEPFEAEVAEGKLLYILSNCEQSSEKRHVTNMQTARVAKKSDPVAKLLRDIEEIFD